MIGRSIDSRGAVLFLKFTGTSLALLLVKLFLTAGFLHFLSGLAAYAFTHGIIFFVSYVAHSWLTFGQRVETHRMKRFFKAVILLKIFDYLVFALLFGGLNIQAGWAIAGATLCVAVIRFCSIKNVLTQGSEANGGAGINRT